MEFSSISHNALTAFSEAKAKVKVSHKGGEHS